MKEILNPKLFYVELVRLLESASKSNDSLFVPMTLALIACSVVYAFLGYRIYKWILRVVGFIAGVMLVTYFIEFFHLSPTQNRMYLQQALSIIFGLAGALLAPKVFHVITLILGGWGMVLVLNPLFPLIDESYRWIAMLLVFAAGGFVSIFVTRITLAISTAVMGSYLLTAFSIILAVHFKVLPAQFHFFIFYAAWILLSLFSTTVQLTQKDAGSVFKL